MKAVPMTFNTQMVQALIDERKSVTRRPLLIPDGWSLHDGKLSKITSSHPKKGKLGALIRRGVGSDFPQSDLISAPCFVGDLIYVRETFATLGHNDYEEVSPRNRSEIHEVRFKASESDGIANCPDWEVRGYHWRPSIHMPRWASRLTLKVTDVRIETLNDLRKSKSQIKKESFDNWPQFKHVWQSIYGQSHPNDYVWVIEFVVIHKNVDDVIREMEAE